MKASLIILIIFLCQEANASRQIMGTVTNEADLPVAFVNIGLVNTEIGTVSDLNGSFKLFLPETTAAGQLLRFSCIGYETVEIEINELTSDRMVIILKESIVRLGEVQVKPPSIETKTKGNNSENTAIKTNLAIRSEPNMNLGSAIGRKFNMSKGANFLNSLKFYVAANNFDTLTVRVSFHTIEKGKPGDPIHQNPIYHQMVNHRRGWVDVDLIPHQIISREDLIAVVEWVGASERGNTFAFNISMPAMFQTHFYKYGSQNNWKTYHNMSSSMILEFDREK